jgi:hypothetical protein
VVFQLVLGLLVADNAGGSMRMEEQIVKDLLGNQRGAE